MQNYTLRDAHTGALISRASGSGSLPQVVAEHFQEATLERSTRTVTLLSGALRAREGRLYFMRLSDGAGRGRDVRVLVEPGNKATGRMTLEFAASRLPAASGVHRRGVRGPSIERR